MAARTQQATKLQRALGLATITFASVVLVMDAVNLIADMTHEGTSSIHAPYLGLLGARGSPLQ